MSTQLRMSDFDERSLAVGLADGGDLWRYTFAPDTPGKESSRPYIHPLHSLEGDVLSNFRPNDHPWHHGLSFTLTSVDGVNFWGGPSHRGEDGYQWREDHGTQRHVEWMERTPECVRHRLAWQALNDERVLLDEVRTLRTTVSDRGWQLDWCSEIFNPREKNLTCHNYHSLGGLEGSHYSGLQFRGARGLLDQHGDDAIRLLGENGKSDIDALHGTSARTLEWHVQSDGSLRRHLIRFEAPDGPIPWFIRPHDPMVAFAPHRETAYVLPAGQTTVFNHTLHFLRA
ncbi:MAG: PmoA family protein [Synoicihabitans sp.]